MISRSRPLQVLLLLGCGVTAVPAKEPGAVFGGGTQTCKAFVEAVKKKEKDRHALILADMVMSWVQGYFSGRNVGGHLRRAEDNLTVGGTMSVDTLQAMLVDQCNEMFHDSGPVLVAAEELYNKLQAKGL